MLKSHTGIALAKQSLALVKTNKSLLIFPLISSTIVITTFTLAMIPLVKIEAAAWENGGQVDHTTFIIFFIILFSFFLIANLTTFSFNAALTSCIVKHIRNEPYTLGAGFKIIAKHLWRIYVWKLLATTGGAIIRFCHYWFPEWPVYKTMNDTFFKNIPWNIATLFALPLIITENVSPLKAIPRSATLIKAAFGTTIKARFGISLILFCIRTSILIPLIIVVALTGSHAYWIILSIITVMLWLGASVLNSTTQIVLISALYLHALKDRRVEKFYDVGLLKKALS